MELARHRLGVGVAINPNLACHSNLALAILGFLITWAILDFLLTCAGQAEVGVYLRTWVICASTMIVACAVSICGIIGWVGLLVPHIARLLCGSENTRLIPLTTVLGAVFLVVIDSLSRTLASEQIPISILTSLVGAPFFIYILRKNTRN
ncbi:MAG: iron ABC transporter permease [Helicobacter sp.]|nr:iron ABC transporter permease [Helicobacter sp.]